MDTDNIERTPETAENQPKQETPASGQDVITANSRGGLIRKTRLTREKPYSCADLAGLINVSTATMSLIERNKCPVSDARLAKIAKVLSLPFDVLKNEKGAEFSPLTAWQQHLQKKYSLDNEALATLLQIAIEAKLYQFDAPDTRSLPQWEQFYEEMCNFLPRTTVQDRMLQNKTILALIDQQKNESAEEAFNRYLARIDTLVEPIIRSVGYDFANPPSQPFNDLYLAAICKTHHIKVITIEPRTNTDVVKQQLFSLNVPEAIGSFIALSEDRTQYTAVHTVENAPDGIRRHLILQDKRNLKAIDSAHKLRGAITEILLGPELMDQIASLKRTDGEASEWLCEASTLRIEFPPSVLTRLIDAQMSPDAKTEPLSWMDKLYTIYGPTLQESRVFGEFTRQVPFPLCHFVASFEDENSFELGMKINHSYASPSATEKGMVIQECATIQKHQRLGKLLYMDPSKKIVNRVETLDNSLVTELRLPESLIGTSVRIIAKTNHFITSFRVFLVPDFTNTPTKDPYADW